MQCKLNNIYYKYGENTVLKDVSMEISHGDIISIIGPSGAGKTTLLKIITGLLKPSSGNMSFIPEPSKDRPRIIVFQDYQLFPHMDVYNNVAFGLKARKLGKEYIKTKVLEYLDYFGLSNKTEKFPDELSAGEKQRVAIARAMVVEPSLLLLDEPFANLDYNLKSDTAQFIRKTQKDFNVTTICVTHDQREAFAMSDKIGVLLDGELLELRTTKDLFNSPHNVKAAEFIGPVNRIPINEFRHLNIKGIQPKSNICVRANDIEIIKDDSSIAQIQNIIYNGETIRYIVICNGLNYISCSMNSSLKVRDRVSININNYLMEE
ncbi:MAG: ABC transporter ATP-binding protein [Spirochaetaceae bacterium]